MDATVAFLSTNPFWIWLALGAALLAAELATGSGWLLWPAACAGVMAVLTAFLPIPAFWAALLFAVLVIGSTYASRRLLRPPEQQGQPDINDTVTRLVGHSGAAVTDFVNGSGRVFVDGKEWAAEAEGEAAPAREQKVRVTGVNGAVLRVRLA